ncbi:MAG: hypothetical protein J2O46_04810 [Nocardioides sp.]|nr:hypothetical protein [Nocardioides sp.]
MWETDQAHMSRDMPCPRCGHPAHTYLPCSDSCDCPPTALPGAAGNAEADDNVRVRVLVV